LFLVDYALFVEEVDEPVENLEFLQFDAGLGVAPCACSDVLVAALDFAEVASGWGERYLTIFGGIFSIFLLRSLRETKLYMRKASCLSSRSQIYARSASSNYLLKTMSFRRDLLTSGSGLS
jgi:hypothetical protein